MFGVIQGCLSELLLVAELHGKGLTDGQPYARGKRHDAQNACHRDGRIALAPAFESHDLAGTTRLIG